MAEFTRYIALGDSVSIDLYPALDAGEIDVAVALERDASVGRVAPIGAASLLYQNADDHWPDYAGDDLVSRSPAVEMRNLAADGATIGEVFGEQVPDLDSGDDPVLVTLTVGGNDLLSAYGNRPRRSLLERIERDVAEAYDFLIDLLRAQLPNGTFVLADVYAHFLGHGVSAAEADRWYWRRSLIEPNARGASEVRAVWLESLRAANLLE
jgi:lysophospholipase L1-like esterase